MTNVRVRAERLLMGPGPVNVYPVALETASRPMMGHLDPVFLDILDETNERLRTVFGTSNALTFPISGTGSAGMQAAFVNWVKPGDVVVVGVNGVFGNRMCDVAERLGAEVVRVDHAWGQPVSAERVLDAHDSPDIIAVVHAETSTGVRSDIAPIGAGKGDALLVVDCVTSVGGIPVELDEWGVDIAYAGTQKCLGASPGLSPFTASDRALDRMLERPSSWYLDLNLIAAYVRGGGSGRAYHHTAPINEIRALHAVLGEMLEEGLDNVHARHSACGGALAGGLVELGFTPYAAEGHRLGHLATAYLPEGFEDGPNRRTLLDDYDIEVGGGLGDVAGKIWRVSTMGHSARMSNVNRLLAALAELI